MSKLVTKNTTAVRTRSGYDIALPLAEPRGRRRLRCVRVATLKREIGKALSAGYEVRCPLTGKRIKIYRRGLHRSQIWTLRRLRDRSDKLGLTYLPIEVFSPRRDGDLAKLVMWGLAERLKAASRYEAEKVRGKWRITKIGRQFLEGRRAIARQVAVLLGEKLCDVPGPLITVGQIDSDFIREQLEVGKDGAGEVA